MTIDDKSVSDQPRAKSRRRTYAVAGAAVVLLGLGGIYGIASTMRNVAGDPACAAAVNLSQRTAPLMKGEVAALTPAKEGLKIPDIGFQDRDGNAKTLADWRGRVVLLNLWATWCVPCRAEMPALDALQQKLGGKNFEVVALNIDTRDPEKPKAFYKEIGIASLSYFADEKAKSLQQLKQVGRLIGMPTSVLIDGKGCEIATLSGPAEWASDDAVALIRGVLDKI